MNDLIEQKVNGWSLNDTAFREINHQIIHLEKRLFSDYLPCQSIDSDFFLRFKKWLLNSKDDKDQKILFQLVPHLFYISQQEINSLYYSAYNVEVARWLVDCLGMNFSMPNPEALLQAALVNTWFCPVTDSFIINDFIKVNNIPSRFDLRPDWHSLVELGDPGTIANYVKLNNIERIVMLEDFVGSGSQVESRIKFASKCLANIPILFISLVTCPEGVPVLNSLCATYTNLTVKHIVELPPESFISPTPAVDEPMLFNEVRDVAMRLYSMVTNGAPGPKPYSPFGYKETGALIVLMTNTPDNTLPLIHFESTTWSPLFKRITRV